MLLTIGELWVAADKSVLHAIPMLQNYGHEIPIRIWRALLLSSRADMERLDRLETYLLRRKKVAQSENRPSIFRSYGEKQSFPVEYFAQSLKHQDLKARIEKKAAQERETKRAEFRRLKDEHRNLMQKHGDSTHEEVEVVAKKGFRHWRAAHDCRHCQYLNEANELKIYVHEWPLSNDELEARATVFELDAPSAFCEWRDTTLYLIDNVLGCKSPDSRSPNWSSTLGGYSGLSSHFRSGEHRVHLLSEDKPHAVTHRDGKSVGFITESDVCLNNGLNFQYFDGSHATLIQQHSPSLVVSEVCTFNLPKHAQALKRFLVRTWAEPDGQTPNQVIASQSDCPDYMSMGEYKALAVLPYGYRLNWMSILTQLAMPAIDFNKAETMIFLLQMSLQAGPNDSATVTRCSHTRLTDPTFGSRMLRKLGECVSRVQASWESHTALCSFTLLATRLLSLAAQDLHQNIFDLLRQCREISYGWMIKLLDKVQETADDAQRKEFLGTALNIALICADSFNVGDKFMPAILED
ncbi:hypothetical protein FZEAL_941 [Fusarium zealandicum]|uniref:Uncharacterized protein n=1 Tax=Fusarium zealandicum TaxID=1053134 RepID=A0A8H4UTZ8_9HYPO|nr:hypothetical protein FZEAL_941 [Fusarium zealandicum]